MFHTTYTKVHHSQAYPPHMSHSLLPEVQF
jgi:hypothetical protein